VAIPEACAQVWEEASM
jgi:hypothetical protein